MITKVQIFNFFSLSEDWINKNPDSKFSYAVKKMRKRVQSIVEDYIDDVEQLRVDHASIDEKGNLKRDMTGSLVMTPEKSKGLIDKIRELGRETVLVEPYRVDEIPALSVVFEETIDGLIIKNDNPV